MDHKGPVPGDYRGGVLEFEELLQATRLMADIIDRLYCSLAQLNATIDDEMLDDIQNAADIMKQYK